MQNLFEELHSLPNPPFHVYFLVEMAVFPKRLFIVTRLFATKRGMLMYIPELRDSFYFDPDHVQVVSGFAVN